MLIYEQTFRYRARNKSFTFYEFEKEVVIEYIKTYQNDFKEFYAKTRDAIEQYIKDFNSSSTNRKIGTKEKEKENE
jgi:chloramphenicol O-acetyltransferase